MGLYIVATSLAHNCESSYQHGDCRGHHFLHLHLVICPSHLHVALHSSVYKKVYWRWLSEVFGLTALMSLRCKPSRGPSPLLSSFHRRWPQCQWKIVSLSGILLVLSSIKLSDGATLHFPLFSIPERFIAFFFLLMYLQVFFCSKLTGFFFFKSCCSLSEKYVKCKCSFVKTVTFQIDR